MHPAMPRMPHRWHPSAPSGWMILPISALARSSCNFGKLFLKQQDRAARRLSGPVFLRREIKKNDFFSVLALSVSHCSTAYSLFLALPFSPNRRKSAKGRTLGKTGSFAVLPKPLTLGEVALRSNDGEGKAADKQILPRSDTELVSAPDPNRYTEPVKSHSSRNLEKLPVFCRNLSLKWQL